jgi:hypothetical protein
MSTLEFPSPEDDRIWRAALTRAASAWRDAEVASVAAGLRDACLAHVRPAEMAQAWRKAREAGLVLLPVATLATSKTFVHRATLTMVNVPAPPGEAAREATAPSSGSDSEPERAGAWTYRVVISRTPTDARRMQAALADTRSTDIARLLGYPSCCAEWFASLWGDGVSDPAWIMLAESAAPGVDLDGFPSTIRLAGIEWAALNPVLRYAGIRLVPHIPHSLTCAASQAMAVAWQERLATDTTRDAFAVLNRALSLPMTAHNSPAGLVVTTDHFQLRTAAADAAGHTRYSLRSATTGSMREARHDGTNAASRPAATTTPAAVANTAGSRGFIA